MFKEKPINEESLGVNYKIYENLRAYYMNLVFQRNYIKQKGSEEETEMKVFFQYKKNENENRKKLLINRRR